MGLCEYIIYANGFGRELFKRAVTEPKYMPISGAFAYERFINHSPECLSSPISEMLVNSFPSEDRRAYSSFGIVYRIHNFNYGNIEPYEPRTIINTSQHIHAELSFNFHKDTNKKSISLYIEPTSFRELYRNNIIKSFTDKNNKFLRYTDSDKKSSEDFEDYIRKIKDIFPNDVKGLDIFKEFYLNRFAFNKPDITAQYFN